MSPARVLSISDVIKTGHEALKRFFPGWDEASNMDRASIMLPPSYDLLKHYLGPKDCNDDGFNDEVYHRMKVDMVIFHTAED